MKTIFTIFMILFAAAGTQAQDMKSEINLSGKWKFEIGDDEEYAKTDFDDSDWDDIRVPSSWESRGYPGYDGFAWYRTTFVLGKTLQNKALVLRLGQIDDVDMVYINGHFIGGLGVLPPHYQTAYNLDRNYPLTNEYLKFGDTNVIAVRVYDDQIQGGIVSGSIGIYSYKWVNLLVNLSGKWLFSIGNHREWSREKCDESHFEPILVPATWESQGYGEYDGYAWYRKTFFMDKDLRDEKLILALGKIDDCDEVYFNGIKIGSTGHFPDDYEINQNNNYYNRNRYYTLPDRLINWNGENTIAVKVYDVWGLGGIYEGPVGITTRKEYTEHRKSNTEVDRILQDIFDDWFK
jgi:hypothetical protein